MPKDMCEKIPLLAYFEGKLAGGRKEVDSSSIGNYGSFKH